MRKLFLSIVFLIMVVAFVTHAQQIIYTDSATVEWDAVTTDVNGDPLNPADPLTYELVYAEPNTHTNMVAFGITVNASMVVNTPAAGPWAYGARAILVTDGGVTYLYSAYTWSDVEGTPSPFVLSGLATILPGPPDGLRLQ